MPPSISLVTVLAVALVILGTAAFLLAVHLDRASDGE